MIESHRIPFIQGANTLRVTRSDPFGVAETFKGYDNRMELKVTFEGEITDHSSDAGGISKEWFGLLVKKMQDPASKLFKKCETEEMLFFPDEESKSDPAHLDHFEFLGLAIAKALFDKIPLNLCLNRQVYKYLLDIHDDCVLDDLRHFDTVLYNSLTYINEASIDADTLIEQYFVHEHADGTVHELAVGGAEIRVTDDNKMQYTLVKVEYLTRDIVIDQLAALKKGFNRLIHQAWLRGFKPEELERAICGTSHISIDEWRGSS